MTFVSKNADDPKYKIDMSQGKYSCRRECLLNILFHACELPNDLYHEMNLSYDNYRKIISDLSKRGFIKRVSQDGITGYKLTLKGKRLATSELRYLKYQDCAEEESDRHHSAKRRRRKRQFAYLYALLDRAGVPYEVFAKPPIEDVDVNDNMMYFYTALDFKRMINIESTPFQGSKLLGFLIGRGRIISIYRTGFLMPTFGKHETLIPEYVKRYFSVPLNTAIMICSSGSAVKHILYQIIEGKSYEEKSVNTAEYKNFYVLPSDDSFLSRLNDLYTEHTETERELIDRYRINTSNEDANGRIRFLYGTGFIDDDPVLICPGNVNAEKLKYFVLNAGQKSSLSYIFCKYRDLAMLQELTKDKPIIVITID